MQKTLLLAACLVLVDSSFDRTIAWALNCAEPYALSFDWCVNCTQDVGDVWFKCTEPKTYLYCDNYVQHFHCAETTNTYCPGTRRNYVTYDDCDAYMNLISTETCQLFY